MTGTPFGSGNFGAGLYGGAQQGGTMGNANLLMTGATGKVALGPLGATMPTTAIAALDAALKDYGLISDDGLTEANATTWQSFKPWGSTRPAKRSLTDSSTTFQLTFWESTNPLVLGMYHGLPTLPTVSSAGAFDFARPSTVAPVFFSMVADIAEGNRIHRIANTKIQIIDKGNVVYNQGAIIGYQVTCDAQGDIHDYYSDPVQATS